MNKKLKVALYSRVSTADQTIENQLIALRDYCQRNNYEIVGEFSDSGISGVKTSRPELDKMLQVMREKKFEAVIVYKFDRLGRSTSHLLQVLEELKNKGVRLIATSQNIDTSTSMGKFFFTILSGFAEMEREMIVERVNLGLARVRAEGKKLGRPEGAKDIKRRRRSGYLLRWQNNKVLV
jgi:site-specific DNA recombinase